MLTLQTPSRLLVGDDALSHLTEMARGHERIMLFTDAGLRAAGLAETVLTQLRPVGADITIWDQIKPEPSLDDAQEAVSACQSVRPTLIVALGGGSVMDVAKLASVTCDGNVTIPQLMERPELGRKSAFTMMMPTTAGTGAEATPNAIVTVPDRQLKVGIVHQAMIADAVLLIPRWLRSIPQHIAASAGVDALAHAIECFTSKKATPLSDLYALEAMRLIFPNIVNACNDGDEQARQAMMLGAYYAGVAIAGSGTTAVHALSYPLGGRFHVPHGVANAILLAPVMRFNLPACETRLARVFDALLPVEAKRSISEKALSLLKSLQDIVTTLCIPKNFASFGVRPEHLDELVDAGMKVTRLLNNNPRPISAADARAIYREVLL